MCHFVSFTCLQTPGLSPSSSHAGVPNLSSPSRTARSTLFDFREKKTTLLLQQNHGSRLGVGLEIIFFLFFQGVYILFCCSLALHLIPEWWVVLGSSP